MAGEESDAERDRVASLLCDHTVEDAPDLDFRRASVTGDVKVTTISLMGALSVIVPAGVEVDVGGLALQSSSSS